MTSPLRVFVAAPDSASDEKIQSVRAALISARVEMLAEPYSDTMGHAGAVLMHPDGSLEGAHDPRADGGAAGV